VEDHVTDTGLVLRGQLKLVRPSEIRKSHIIMFTPEFVTVAGLDEVLKRWQSFRVLLAEQFQGNIVHLELDDCRVTGTWLLSRQGTLSEEHLSGPASLRRHVARSVPVFWVPEWIFRKTDGMVYCNTCRIPPRVVSGGGRCDLCGGKVMPLAVSIEKPDRGTQQ